MDVGTDIEELAVSRLMRARKNLRLSQSDVAEKLGVDVTNVSRIETGETRLTVIALARYCALLNLAPADVVSFGAASDGAERENLKLIGSLRQRVAELERALEGVSKIIAPVTSPLPEREPS